jgi:alkylated DNA repair dioxygenase AlkB
MTDQLGFFEPENDWPEGFKYTAEIISTAQERELLAYVQHLPLEEFQFHGYVGKRRTMSFGWHYDFAHEKLERGEDIPSFLLPLREVAATFAGLDADELQQALVIEYGQGAAIGWHRDKPAFGDVIGVSLLSACRFRFRRQAGRKWERVSLTAEPRSAYLLRGPSRTQWEHSIPAVDALRYSITFRTLRAGR